MRILLGLFEGTDVDFPHLMPISSGKEAITGGRMEVVGRVQIGHV